MIFAFITDSQIRGVTPINRKGDYLGDLVIKFQEFIDVGLKMNADAFVHGGDFFDSPLVSLSIADTFIDMMEKTGKDWYIVRGNHDEIGHNPNLSGESMLDHIFRRSKCIREMGARALRDETAFVQGFDYYHGIENDIREKGLMCCMPHLNCPKIAVVHGMITPFSLHPKIMQVKTSEIKTDFNLVLCGHFHQEFGFHKEGKVTYVGIGAFARMSIAEWDVKRVPNMLIVNTHLPMMKVVPLKTAKPWESLFDLAAIQEQDKFENRIDDFIHSLESTKVQGLSLRGVIEDIAKRDGVDRKVIDEVVRRISELESEICI